MPKLDHPIVIAGAGPAGSTLAIRLRRLGLPVVLIERYRFPREKLCGEFISPECLEHFAELGVLDEMLSAGGDRVYRTDFYETGGRSIRVPSRWLSDRGFALSLSRSRMDDILLRAAERSGAVVHQQTTVAGLITSGGAVTGIKTRQSGGKNTEIECSLAVDATGRGRVLARLAERSVENKVARARFIGFKAHFRNAALPRGVCEIYGFRGGYAGLSWVENNTANLCLLANASLLNDGNDADRILASIVKQNRRAAKTLAGTERIQDWLAVSVPSFGLNRQPALEGLIAVGDSAAFVDPFTGSGMLMAMESSASLARCVGRLGPGDRHLKAAYLEEHNGLFTSRLRVSGLVRRIAYDPLWSGIMVRLVSRSERLSLLLARGTRSRSGGAFS